MKTLKIQAYALGIILVLIGGVIGYSIAERKINTCDSISNIEHIQNVDEMEVTPDEIYIFTPKGKYMFDGVSIELIEEY